MNVPRLGVVYLERLVWRVLVASINETSMKRNDVGHEISPELLHIFSPALASDKFLPCLEEIFERDDIMVAMLELNPSQTTKAPPQPDFAGLE